jgi:RNA polymerase sigma-54 factor
MDLRDLVDQEMLDNPVLEEQISEPEITAENQTPELKKESPESIEKMLDTLSSADDEGYKSLSNADINEDESKKDFAQSLITKKVSLQDFLLKQLGIFAQTDEELSIGLEIIGNIDNNGYLRASIEEIAHNTNTSIVQVEKALLLVQRFDPAGVGARNIPECLLIQLAILKENNTVIINMVKYHLENIANRNFAKIAKALNQPVSSIETLVAKISSLNPKPGRNYSVEEVQQVVPDIIIEETEEGGLSIIINHENIPRFTINKSYRMMLKQKNLDAQAKEFITNKLRRAYELIRAVSKRQSTLRKVVEAVVEVQKQAITEDFSLLKPLTFCEVAEKIGMHESTVCRVVMNKYAQTPCGVFDLKEFFPSKLSSTGQNGEAVSSELIRSLITDLISDEDKRHPLSDEDIVKLIKEKNNLTVARRTIAKYREELKILSSSYRRNR